MNKLNTIEYKTSTGSTGLTSWSTLTKVPFDDIKERIEEILKIFPSYNGEKVVEVKCSG